MYEPYIQLLQPHERYYVYKNKMYNEYNSCAKFHTNENKTQLYIYFLYTPQYIYFHKTDDNM